MDCLRCDFLGDAGRITIADEHRKTQRNHRQQDTEMRKNVIKNVLPRCVCAQCEHDHNATWARRYWKGEGIKDACLQGMEIGRGNSCFFGTRATVFLIEQPPVSY